MTRPFFLAACLAWALGLSDQVVVPIGPGGPPGAGPQSQARPGTSLLTGRVVAGHDNAPVAAATVSLGTGAGARGNATRVLTDGQGRYFFSAVSAGSYTLTVTKPGWIPGALGRSRPGGSGVPVVVADGQRQGDLDLRLWKFAVIAGRVTDEAGDPMVGVDVRAFRVTYGGGRAQPTFIVRARTDDRGIYRFSALEPGDYLLCVPATVTTEPSGFTAVIAAERETPRPYLQTMSAVGTAPMTLDRSTGYSGDARWGVSSILQMPGSPTAGGPWTTYATTYAPSTTSRTAATIVRAVSGDDRAGVDIVVRLVPTYRVSGSLVGPDGPAPHHAVHLLAADTADAPTVDAATAITDNAGLFTFHGVAAGNYVARVVRTPWPAGGARLGITGGTGAIATVSTYGSGPAVDLEVPGEPLLHVSQPVTVGDRDVSNVALRLQSGARVAGRLQFDGTADRPGPDVLARLQIALEPAAGQLYSNVLPGVATRAGTFAMASTWPGRYLIRVPNPPAGWALRSALVQGRDVSEVPLDLSIDIDDVVLVFTDKKAALEGTVRFDAGTPPVASFVILFPTAREGWVDYGRTSRRVRGVSAATSGTFTMPAPPEGEYFLVAIPDVDANDWQNPAFLERLSAVAERVQVRDGQAATRALRLRRVP